MTDSPIPHLRHLMERATQLRSDLQSTPQRSIAFHDGRLELVRLELAIANAVKDHLPALLAVAEAAQNVSRCISDYGHGSDECFCATEAMAKVVAQLLPPPTHKGKNE